MKASRKVSFVRRKTLKNFYPMLTNPPFKNAFTPSTTLRRRYDLCHEVELGVNLWRKGRSAALTLMIPSQHFAPSGTPLEHSSSGSG